MKALIIIEMQRDFMPGGPLAVPGADALAPIINKMMDRFDCVVASQDWHPKGHVSFTSTQEGEEPPWPAHCIQGTPGAEIVPELDIEKVHLLIKKGRDLDIDSYSAFFNIPRKKETPLAAYLRKLGVDTVYIAGVATDVCVYHTALDALDLGFKVCIIEDACRGIDPKDVEKVFADLKAKGARIVQSTDLS